MIFFINIFHRNQNITFIKYSPKKFREIDSFHFTSFSSFLYFLARIMPCCGCCCCSRRCWWCCIWWRIKQFKSHSCEKKFVNLKGQKNSKIYHGVVKFCSEIHKCLLWNHHQIIRWTSDFGFCDTEFFELHLKFHRII